MTDVMIWDPIELLLWGFVAAMGIATAILYFNRGNQRDNKWEKTFLFGFAALFLCMVLSRLFFILSYFQVQGTYENHIFYGDYNDVTPLYENHIFYGDYNDVTPLYEILIRLCMVTSAIGMISFLFIFERFHKRTRYLFTMTSIAFLVLVIILPFNLSYILNNFIFVPLYLSILVLIFSVLTKYSPPEFKTVAPLIFFGFILAVSSITLTDPAIKEINMIPLFLPPMLMIFALVLLLISIIANPSYISRRLIYCVIFGISTIIIILAFLTFIFFYDLPIFLFLALIIGISLFLYTVYRIIKLMGSDKLPERSGEIQKVIGMFSRPKRITEEEITVAKEKGICLVCKNEILGITFVCRDCKTLYCEKCFEALTQLENACWPCHNALDESKPVKLLEKKEEQEADIEKKPYKKEK